MVGEGPFDRLLDFIVAWLISHSVLFEVVTVLGPELLAIWSVLFSLELRSSPSIFLASAKGYHTLVLSLQAPLWTAEVLSLALIE